MNCLLLLYWDQVLEAQDLCVDSPLPDSLSILPTGSTLSTGSQAEVIQHTRSPVLKKYSQIFNKIFEFVQQCEAGVCVLFLVTWPNLPKQYNPLKNTFQNKCYTMFAGCFQHAGPARDERWRSRWRTACMKRPPPILWCCRVGRRISNCIFWNSYLVDKDPA